MIKYELIDELQLIAFSDMSNAKSKIKACSTLYKLGHDPSRIVTTLEKIASAAATPDQLKVTAIDLLHKIDSEIGNAPIQDAIDATLVTEQLVEEYCGRPE